MGAQNDRLKETQNKWLSCRIKKTKPHNFTPRFVYLDLYMQPNNTVAYTTTTSTGSGGIIYKSKTLVKNK